MIALSVNGKTFKLDAAPDTPILRVLRDPLGFTGTQYGCGIAPCGACTAHLNRIELVADHQAAQHQQYASA